jgi:eukaryotic-like serine/threonine-protein kinase
VCTAAHSLLLFEHLNNKRQASQLKDAAGRALLSGVIGRKVAKETGFVEPEEAFVCSMLRSLGEYMTVFYLPDEQEEIARTVLNKGVSEDAACRSVLGLTYEELGVGIAREWRLPDNIVQSMRRLPPTLEKPRNPQEALQQLAAFSNELCKSVIQAEPEGQDTAVSDLMQRYTEVLPKKGAPVAALVSGALKDAQDFQRVSNVRLANTDSFRNATRWVESQGGARDGAASPETASAPAADSARRNDGAGYQPDDYRSVVMNGIQDISNALLENYALNDILVMVLETIFRGLGVTRVMFCIVNRKNAQVIARFGLGQDIDTLLRRFRFSLTEQRDPFARVVNEKQDVIYPELGIQLSQIPSWYRTLLAPTAFVMLPVVVNEVCIGVVYCDLEDGDRTFTGTDLNYLNTLRNQAALAIKQRS